MGKINRLYVAWQEPQSRRYFPVACLNSLEPPQSAGYEFLYTKGAKEAREYGFQPFLPFNDLEKTYRSAELFPFFSNRLLPRSREDYDVCSRNLGLSTVDASPVEILARSGGRRATDSVEVFAPPQVQDTPENGHRVLEYFFLAHGLRHFRQCAQDMVNQGLKKGAPLFIMRDLQNVVDQGALVLRTGDYCCVGFLPRYLVGEISELVCRESTLEFRLEQLNPPPAPIQQRMLCRLRASADRNFTPFSSAVYEPLAT